MKTNIEAMKFDIQDIKSKQNQILRILQTQHFSHATEETIPANMKLPINSEDDLKSLESEISKKGQDSKLVKYFSIV